MRIPLIAVSLLVASSAAWGGDLAERATSGKPTARREAAGQILASSSHSGGHHPLKPAVIGFVGGAVLAAVIATGSDGFFSDGDAAKLALLGGVAGGLLGVAVSAGIPAPSPASVDRGPVSAKPRRMAGLGLTMSVRF